MADDTYSRGYRNDPNGRGGTGAPGQPTDPLTELARLIGQSDPFATGAGRDRRPDPRAPENPAPQDWQGNESQYRDRQDHYAPHAHPDDGHASEPHYAA